MVFHIYFGCENRDLLVSPCIFKARSHVCGPDPVLHVTNLDAYGYSNHWRWVLCAILIAVLSTLATPVWSSPPKCVAAAHGVGPGPVDSTAFAALLATCAGSDIQFSAGTYLFHPVGYEVGFYVIGGTSNAPTRLIGTGGSGPEPTLFKIDNTGTYQSLLWIRNTSDVSIKGIRFQGSSYSSGCTSLDYGHAIYIHSDRNAPTSIEDVEISHNVFVNFNGHYWLDLDAQDGSPGIGIASEIAIAENTFDASTAFDGGCASTTNNTYPVYFITLQGSSLSLTGTVNNVSIASNYFLADYVKGAIAIWSGTRRTSVQYNTISNAGRKLRSNAGQKELGRYAILVYDNKVSHGTSEPPNTIAIIANVISNPTSSGIYIAHGKAIQIAHNAISGQTDSYDVQEPKAAIALNHGLDVQLYNNDLANSYTGIAIAGGAVNSNDDWIVVPHGGFGMKVNLDDTSDARIDGLTVATAITDGTPSSIVGFGYAHHCPTGCSESSFTNISQIGWSGSSSLPRSRSLSWYSADHIVTYHVLTEVPNVIFSGISRQATVKARPEMQLAFWPF